MCLLYNLYRDLHFIFLRMLKIFSSHRKKLKCKNNQVKLGIKDNWMKSSKWYISNTDQDRRLCMQNVGAFISIHTSPQQSRENKAFQNHLPTNLKRSYIEYFHCPLLISLSLLFLNGNFCRKEILLAYNCKDKESSFRTMFWRFVITSADNILMQDLKSYKIALLVLQSTIVFVVLIFKQIPEMFS